MSEQDVLKYIQHISNRSISEIKESVENYGQRHVKKNSMFNYGIKYGMSNLDWFKRSFPKDQGITMSAELLYQQKNVH